MLKGHKKKNHILDWEKGGRVNDDVFEKIAAKSCYKAI